MSSTQEKKPTPIDLEFYDGMTNEQINKLINQYINELKFEETKVAKQALANKKQNDGTKFMQTIKEDVEAAARAAKETWDQSIVQINQNFQNEELKIRDKIANVFNNLQQQHKAQLRDIQISFAIEVLKSRERPVTGQLDLHAQAKKLAREGDLDGAIRLRDQADKLKVDELDLRKNQLVDMYDGIKKKAIAKQKKELLVLTEKLQKNLIDLKKTKEFQLSERERAFVVSCHSAEQKGILKFTDRTRKEESRQPTPDEITAIHNILKNIVEELVGNSDILVEFSNEDEKDKTKKASPSKDTKKKGALANTTKKGSPKAPKKTAAQTQQVSTQQKN